MANKQSWVEIFLMPVVVAIVGIVGTLLVTHQQEQNALTQATADRQVKLLEIFSEKVTSKDSAERILAIRMLRAIDGELAAKLASAVAEGEPEKSVVRKVAEEAVAEATARARQLPRVYIHIQGDDDRTKAEQMSTLLRKEGLVVPGIERVGVKAPTNAQLRYFRSSEEDEAKRIVGLLGKNGMTVDLQYVKGYEKSDNVRPMLFELWFASH